VGNLAWARPHQPINRKTKFPCRKDSHSGYFSNQNRTLRLQMTTAKTEGMDAYYPQFRARFCGFRPGCRGLSGRGCALESCGVDVVRTSASAWAGPHGAVTVGNFSLITQGRSFRSEPLLVASTSPG